MATPLVFMLEDPSDNEIKLLNQIKRLQSALDGMGGPLNGWGFSSGPDGGLGAGGFDINNCVGFLPGSILMVGALGQITPDTTATLSIDSVNKRVGVNTCKPLYPLDVHSNECDTKMAAFRTGNISGDIDLFPCFDPNPIGRLRVTRSDKSTLGKISIYTSDFASPPVMTERLAVGEVVDIKTGFALSGDITPTIISANQNDYRPAGLSLATVIRVSSTASKNITGIDATSLEFNPSGVVSQGGATRGRILMIHNVGTEDIVLVHESSASLPRNRFFFPGSVAGPLDITLTSGVMHTLYYDDVIHRWRSMTIGSSGTGVRNRMAYWTNTATLGALPAFSPGYLFLADSLGLLKQSGDVYWNDTNKKMHLGENFAEPLFLLHLRGGGPSHAEICIDGYGGVGGALIGGNGALSGGGTSIDWKLLRLAGAGNHVLDGTNIVQGELSINAAEIWAVGAHGTYIQFRTTPTGSTTMAERFRIGPAGQWGIGGATYGTAGQAFLSGGASAPPTWTTITNALLDGANHTDTLAGSVARGDIIVGNSTPKWARVAKGSAGAFLRGDGTDTAWSTLILPNAATANRLVYATASNTWGESADLTYDGTDLAIASGKRFRMQSQNRTRYLNSLVIATRTTDQSINASTWTAVALNATDVVDTDGLHDPASNNSRLTAAIAGKYQVSLECFMETMSVGARLTIAINKNTAGTFAMASVCAVGSVTIAAAMNPAQTISVLVDLAASDHVEAWINHDDSAGAKNLAGATIPAYFSMAYIGE